MKRTAVISAAILPLLAACGSSSTTVGGSSSTAVGETPIVPGSIYSPVYTGGDFNSAKSALQAEGVTGFVGNSDGTVSEISVRVDDEGDEPIVYLSIDGEPEITYDEFASLDEFGILISNANGDQLNARILGRPYGSIELSNDVSFDRREGYFGLETAAVDLREGTVTYTGNWDASSEEGTTFFNAGGRIEMGISFDTGSLIGYTQGGFTAGSAEGVSDGGNLFGVIDGSLENSRIAATMTVLGDASGELDMLGAVYGENSTFVAGGIGGNLTTESGTLGLGGDFRLLSPR